MSDLATFLDELSENYLELHRTKEEAFWETRMGLKDRHRELAEAEVALKEFLGDAARLAELRRRKSSGDAAAQESHMLDGWILMFSRNQIEDPEAKEILRDIMERETELQKRRGEMELGYRDSEGHLVRASSVALGNAVRSDPDPAIRRASFEGLRSIEDFVLENGYLEIVKLRNRFARKIGFQDYYDYKVHWAEGFDKATLFRFLDDLEARTVAPARNEIRELESRLGAEAVEPWNFAYHTRGGTVQEERDPYFRFEDALERWIASFAALGVRFRGAKVTLDLIDRIGKYENGFMHGPVPAFHRRGEWLPAEINFTANALPGKTGSGHRAIQTLFHEGGHAAHFANVVSDAPCFSQEYAPTSVAFAETQSMFCDRLLKDAAWQARYARNSSGEAIPFELIEKDIRLTHPFAAQNIRNLLVVCYGEKALYEIPEDDLTTQNVLKTFREVEARITQVPSGCPRPMLAVPHLLSWQSAASYHGYVLAQMAVFQTREHFQRKYGFLVDNPRIGQDLAEIFWAPGNSKGFLELIEEMTGKALSTDALVDEVCKSSDAAVEQAREGAARDGRSEDPARLDLDLRLRVIHGPEEVVPEGTDPARAGQVFRRWVMEKWPGPAATSQA
jgi:Zn-dependent oligopeptidase